MTALAPNSLNTKDPVCKDLADGQIIRSRELLTRMTDKWSLWALGRLADAAAPLRFSRLLGGIGGVSQKSLTKTLRALEREGLVTRKVFAEVPPRVEYRVTPLGSEMMAHIEPLWRWIAGNLGRFGEPCARPGFPAGETAPMFPGSGQPPPRRISWRRGGSTRPERWPAPLPSGR